MEVHNGTWTHTNTDLLGKEELQTKDNKKLATDDGGNDDVGWWWCRDDEVLFEKSNSEFLQFGRYKPQEIAMLVQKQKWTQKTFI